MKNIKQISKRVFKAITSPEMILVYSAVGAVLKVCFDIAQYRSESKQIGFKK